MGKLILNCCIFVVTNFEFAPLTLRRQTAGLSFVRRDLFPFRTAKLQHFYARVNSVERTQTPF